MTTVQPRDLPQTASLRRCQEGGAFADCYVTEVDGAVSQSEFVEAFYTTGLFKVERLLLKWFAGRPSSDLDAKRLGDGTTDSFAAWRVESRSSEQLLLADFTGRTKSWLMVEPLGGASPSSGTRLYFGSAVVAKAGVRGGTHEMGLAFHALLGFHRLYSRLLLKAARSRVLANRLSSAH